MSSDPANLVSDRPDTYVLGPQVEAPISHLTVLRDGGSSGQAATIVPYGRWSRPKARPANIAAVLRLCLEPRL
ncbi:hypothetical protein GCM10014715_16930 [Streptomyces spiralis]|uniref:Uncharacterized protein n=1 Tax=Streptomyces spiralis TaxID=66376 RepID=A0A918ZQW8_9ACTN|nr:hypothetical protein GCM10014715_16930 [Streptomyces spiralis]